MSDEIAEPLEAEFHALRHILPLEVGNVDARLLQVHINVLYGKKGYDLEKLRIVRSRTIATEWLPKGEEERREIYYASLISLGAQADSGFIVLLRGPPFVAITTQPGQTKKGASWIGSSGPNLTDQTEKAKRYAVRGLLDAIEIKMHDAILVAEKETSQMKDLQVGEKFSSLYEESNDQV